MTSVHSIDSAASPKNDKPLDQEPEEHVEHEPTKSTADQWKEDATKLVDEVEALLERDSAETWHLFQSGNYLGDITSVLYRFGAITVYQGTGADLDPELLDLQAKLQRLSPLVLQRGANSWECARVAPEGPTRKRMERPAEAPVRNIVPEFTFEKGSQLSPSGPLSSFRSGQGSGMHPLGSFTESRLPEHDQSSVAPPFISGGAELSLFALFQRLRAVSGRSKANSEESQ
jgi:hypothetical protein